MNIGSLNTVIFNEFYHVGRHGKDTDFALDAHKDRLDLKQKAVSGNLKAPKVLLSGRKSNFYRNLLKGIDSHIDKMAIDARKDPTNKRNAKRLNILNRRLGNAYPSYDELDNGNYSSPNSNTLYILSGVLDSDLDKSAYGQLLKKISKDTGIKIEGGVGGKPGALNTHGFKKKLQQDTTIDLDNLLSDDTKKELLKFEKDLRMTRRYHKLGSKDLISPQDQAESIGSTVNGGQTEQEKQQTKEVASLTENIKKQAEKAPQSWIGKKIRSLRDLYSDWLERKNREYDQGKLGFFNGILRIIANCIDWLLEKLQNFAG